MAGEVVFHQYITKTEKELMLMKARHRELRREQRAKEAKAQEKEERRQEARAERAKTAPDSKNVKSSSSLKTRKTPRPHRADKQREDEAPARGRSKSRLAGKRPRTDSKFVTGKSRRKLSHSHHPAPHS